MIPYFKGNLLNDVACSQENDRSNVQDFKLKQFLKQVLIKTHQNAFDKRLIKSVELTIEEQQQLQEVFNSKDFKIQSAQKKKYVQDHNKSKNVEIEIKDQYLDHEKIRYQDEVFSQNLSHPYQKKQKKRSNSVLSQNDIQGPEKEPLSTYNKNAFDNKNQIQPKYLQNI
ncbi:UNKNOWN [Stylonychia lemnae]|uniref:Uncharacterized protein n=1 Tax=Stylonychia lemnae TaxID=5949 RepID=A0A078A1B8_STYLE|nr:UNKNOWN [Stylonychia lemnae]|eukprot:CDW75885.1 UNKNOWN [Stylonychia lemnae]